MSEIKEYESKVVIDSGLREYILKVYRYMSAGLAVSGIAGFLTFYLAPLRNLIFTMNSSGGISLTFLGFVAAFSPLAIVMYFFAKQNSLSLERGKNLFWAYAVLTGISLSSLGMIYTGESILTSLLVCASLFGSMSIYGQMTGRDLTEFGSFLLMGLWGLIIASLLNIFIGGSFLGFMSSVIGVLVFTGLIAYDTQKIKGCYYALESADHVQINKAALVGAFILYLDVVNLFIYLLRFLGVGRKRGSE
jgi:FtsH-binding integral membrane protein